MPHFSAPGGSVQPVSPSVRRQRPWSTARSYRSQGTGLSGRVGQISAAIASGLNSAVGVVEGRGFMTSPQASAGKGPEYRFRVGFGSVLASAVATA